MDITLNEYANANGVSVSTNGFSCPDCKPNWKEDETVDKTDAVYYSGPSGCGYEWYEIKKCNICGKQYAIHNGC